MPHPTERPGANELVLFANFDVQAPELAEGGDGAMANDDRDNGANPAGDEAGPLQPLVAKPEFGRAGGEHEGADRDKQAQGKTFLDWTANGWSLRAQFNHSGQKKDGDRDDRPNHRSRHKPF